MSEANTYERDENSGDAAALALGLLEGAERQTALQQVRTDRSFAAEVAAWQRRFSGLDDGFGEVEPPARVKRALEARLFRRRRRGLGAVWSSAGLWRGLALTGFAAAAVLALRPDLVPSDTREEWQRIAGVEPALPEASLVTALYAPEEGLNVVVLVDRVDAVLRVVRIEGQERPGRELELWLGADAEAAPVSMGLISSGTAPEIEISEEIAELIGADSYFAISDEPPGGSPTGAPTGDVLAAGPIAGVDL